MKYGDLFWVELPARDGREQRGRRPAVIWQDMETFSALPTVLIIPLTSRLTALRFPATVRVEPAPHNTLSTPSVALVFQLGACDIRRFENRLGELSPTEIAQIADVAKSLQKLD